jgi:hypothetical protein
LYTIDRTKKPQKISMFLARPNRTIIGNITMAQDCVQTIKFGQINTLSFSIPYEIVINNKLTRNHIADLVREKFLVKVVFGGNVEWYVITQKKKTMDDSDSISLECYSLGYELKYKKLINYKADSLNCFQVLSECLANTNWKVGYVNPDFYLMYRQFDVSSKTVLDFIDEICETFNGVVTYDTVARTISIWKAEELSVYKGFNISYGKYLETIEDTVSTDEIITRLEVTPNESASINSANPTGQSFIDDFSYFLYPFNRNENREVIESSYFMSDELCHTILDYNELINEQQNTFSELLGYKKTYELELTELNNQLFTLNTELNTILDEIEVARQAGESAVELSTTRDQKQQEVDLKESEIQSKENQITTNDNEISNLSTLLKFENNFTGELLEEINDYIHVEEWSDENQISDEDYFYAASDYIKTVSVPPVNLAMSIVNFFEIVEEQYNWERMSIGDIIKVVHPKLGINAKTRIAEITFNYEDGDISLTISNSKRPESIQKKFERAFYKINKLNTDFNKRKVNWEIAATNFNNRNDRINITPTSPTLDEGAITHKQNDDGSVDLVISWLYPDFNVTNKDADNIDGFMIFLYSDSKPDKYVFGSNLVKETMVNPSLEKRNHIFPSVPSNQYFTVGIKAYRRVDEDINPNGIIFSKLVTTNNGNPYLPSQQVVIKANLDGRVNGVMHTVSVVEPVLAQENDVWLNPTTNVSSVYNGNSWQIQNAGEAQTLNGKTSEDFILTESKGAPNGIATLDGNENVPLSQLDAVSSLIKKKGFGNYTGDGTLSKAINVGFKPNFVKVYTTNENDFSSFITSETGGLLIKFKTNNQYLEGTGANKNTPTTNYGKINATGFITGDSVDTYLNKLSVVYYWEAYE